VLAGTLTALHHRSRSRAHGDSIHELIVEETHRRLDGWSCQSCRHTFLIPWRRTVTDEEAYLREIITGFTLMEGNEDLPKMPQAKHMLRVIAARVLVLFVLSGFARFATSGSVETGRSVAWFPACRVQNDSPVLQKK
jgi:hypothetical protein